jgi:gluconolactonase
MADDLDQVVESSEPERLATGFEFTEGPLWHRDGFWTFGDLPNNLIYRLAPGGEPQVFREDTGRANGTTFDLQGRLIMCEGTNRQVTRMDANGVVAPIAQQLDGKRLNTPNDVVGHSSGSIYFTNPSGRLPAPEQELGFSSVVRIGPGGDLSSLTGDLGYPNGLGFSPGEDILYVTITRADQACIQEKERGEVCKHQLIYAFDVGTDGGLSNQRVFAELSSAEEGVPDGMKVDMEGRVYSTGPGGCWVFDPSGNHLGTIKLPELPANCAWGGPDNQTMLFTARTSVYSMRMKTAGTRVPTAV